ncbi:hypothetical protein [Mycoplasma sp. ATU-Cv-508]|uniref:hypothetical protein n=1 Tax=Mycoplasma sp. ATU-Cv-508 TaxID=2048001 RepID=UPI001F3CACA9
MKEATQNAKYIFLAVPSQVLGDIYQKLAALITVKNKVCLINLAKGFTRAARKLLTLF